MTLIEKFPEESSTRVGDLSACGEQKGASIVLKAVSAYSKLWKRSVRGCTWFEIYETM
jgi:hypothetical protein